ncbi:hypothetical protein LEMLEM_LOCUS12977, partial [Lemmus lemmus]
AEGLSCPLVQESLVLNLKLCLQTSDLSSFGPLTTTAGACPRTIALPELNSPVRGTSSQGAVHAVLERLIH